MSRVESRIESHITPTRALVLLWLLGMCLRITILAVPPVLAQMQNELHLSATAVGLLSSLPVLMLALAALSGSYLVGKLGISTTLIVGLVVLGFGSALRAVPAGILWLYAATVLMAGGVAVLQPAMPAVVREWLPERMGFATAVYTNGLLVGEILPVLAPGRVSAAVGGSWNGVLLLWSVPVLLVWLAVFFFAPRHRPDAAHRPHSSWPSWGRGLTWRLALLFCGINSLYFVVNAFIPSYFVAQGERAYIGPALAALNVSQLPASFVLLWVAQRWERRAWPYTASGLICLAAIGGLVFGRGVWAVAAAGVLGAFNAGALILGLTLPALLSAPNEVARTSASVFTLSYASAALMAYASGRLWDATGVPQAAFALVAGSAVLLASMPALLKRRGELV